MTAEAAPQSYPLNCPYCGQASTRAVSPGPVPETVPSTVRDRLAPRAEVTTVPYTRDVDRFDRPGYVSRDEVSWGGWVGSDFLPALRWDQRFGILTSTTGAWPGVWYRTEACDGCERHFDAYYLFDLENRLPEQFPHLFAQPGKTLALSTNVPASFGVLDRLVGRRSEHSYLRESSLVALAWLVLAATLMLLVRQGLGRLDPWEYAVSLGFLAIGTMVAVRLIGTTEQVLKWFTSDYAFDRELRCDAPTDDETARGNHVRHWMNFTRARFAGRPGRPGGRRTTTEVLGGTMALITLVLATVLDRPGWGELAVRGVDALAWLPIAYLIGSSLQVAGISVHFVLAGVTRIPLRIDRFDPVTPLPALRAVQRYARVTALIIGLGLVSMLALSAAYQGLHVNASATWVDTWIVLIVLTTLFFLAPTLRQPALFFLAGTAAVLAYLVTEGYLDALELPGIWGTLDLRTLIFGSAFTFFLIWETRHGDRLVTRALANTVDADGAGLLRDARARGAGSPDVPGTVSQLQHLLVDVRSNMHGRGQWAPLVASVLLPTILQVGLESLLR